MKPNGTKLNILYMSLFEFLKSKVFLLQVLIAVVIIGILGYLFMHWLTFTTEPGQEDE